MVQSFKIREHSELLVDDKCGIVVNIDLDPLPAWVCIGNLFGDNSLMIDEDEWDGFVRLVNAADERIKEANRA